MGGNDSSKILEAVKKGDEDGVRRLLKKGGDPNYRSSYLCVEVCCFLMEELCKRDYVICSHIGMFIPSPLQDVTVLMVASCKGHPGIVRLLLESSAGVNKTDQVSERTSMNVYWKTRNFTEHFKF